MNNNSCLINNHYVYIYNIKHLFIYLFEQYIVGLVTEYSF